MQFTDIEKLKTERPPSTSPKDRKRAAEEELDSGEWTDVETRVRNTEICRRTLEALDVRPFAIS